MMIYVILLTLLLNILNVHTAKIAHKNLSLPETGSLRHNSFLDFQEFTN